LGESIKRFGLVEPIVWNKQTGHVVGGHQRLRVLRAQGESEASVVVVDLPAKEERALNVALNSPAIAGDWTDDLDRLLDQIQGDTPDLYGDLLLDDLRSETKASVVEDEAPAAQADAISRTGDLWLLGDHRGLCGDSTVAGDVERAMGGEKAALVFTDPPYGVDIQERDMAQAEVHGRRKDGKGVTNDDLTGDDLIKLLRAAFENTLRHASPGACRYVCAPSGVDYRHPLNILAGLGVARHGLVWVKDRFVMGRADYHYRHENMIFGWSPGAAHKPVPSRDQGSVWEFTRPGASPEHPTMKPVALVGRAISNSSEVGGVIFDPFLGSGTTLIAAEQLGRKCFGIEIHPQYVDVTVRRWEKLTGKAATLDGDGRTFAEASNMKGQGR
jgi:DNA modification methylase